MSLMSWAEEPVLQITGKMESTNVCWGDKAKMQISDDLG